MGSGEDQVRLARFIRTDLDRIVSEWEAFARTLDPGGSMDLHELRDHARQMLLVIANDLDTAQTEKERHHKSEGRSDAPVGGRPTAAQAHGVGRAKSGFDIREMVSEYRALRASVIRLWAKAKDRLEPSDIDDLTRFNEAIDQALAESTASFSADLDRTRETFLAILGHDLRTPLGAIFTSAQFLLEVDDPEKVRKMAQVIASSSARMEKMVEDLLVFTRSRLGDRIPIDPEPTDLGEILSAAVDEVRASRPGVDIQVEIEGNLSGEWDRARLSQVFSNLLGNAVDHGASGRRITLKGRAQGDLVACSVHNYGSPIPSSELRHIFEPMTTVGGPRDGNHLGMGLHIADQMVRSHGGEISVTSDSAGTTFTVLVPRRAQGASTPEGWQSGGNQLAG